MKCSKLLLNKDNELFNNIRKKSPKVRFSELYNISQKITRCGDDNIDGCGYKQPEKYKCCSMEGIQAVWSKLNIDDKNNSKITNKPYYIILKCFYVFNSNFQYETLKDPSGM